MVVGSNREARFVEALAQLRVQRPGDAAALRRSLTFPPGEDSRVHRIVYPLLQGIPQADEWRWFLVAGLAALLSRDYDPETRNASLGRILRSLSFADGPHRVPDHQHPLERRFEALLNAEARELHVHLRALVRRCARAGIAVDLASLLRDLQWWDRPERRVQRRWARDFWCPEPKEGTGRTTALSVTTQGELDSEMEGEYE